MALLVSVAEADQYFVMEAPNTLTLAEAGRGQFHSRMDLRDEEPEDRLESEVASSSHAESVTVPFVKLNQ